MGRRPIDVDAGAPSLPVGALALNAELAGDRMQALAPIALAGAQLEPRIGRDGLWIFVGGRLARIWQRA